MDIVVKHSLEENAAVDVVAKPLLIQRLRVATREVHLRMHGHPGFAAVKDGTIDRDGYVRLLTRIYGFYAPYERSANSGPERVRWLSEDLASLEVDASLLRSVPWCATMPDLDSAGRRLGARYVVEGSALGGRELAAGLDGLLGSGIAAGRRFFQGSGSRTGEVWRRSLALFADAPGDAVIQAEIVEAAVETFSVFEHWLAGWNGEADGRYS